MKSRSLALALGLLISLVGCGEDDPVAPKRNGTITINPEPDSINAPWQIRGPLNFRWSGNGRVVFENMAAGDYSVTWGPITNRVTPLEMMQTLAPGGNSTFSCFYFVTPDAPDGFVFIPPGHFLMGSPPDEPGRFWFETRHAVTLTQGFFMAQYEVTEAWWSEVMGYGRSMSQLPKNVGWGTAVQFCNALSLQEGLTPAYEIHSSSGEVTWDRGADGYRLPTEAEWEYACRAGSTTAFANGPLTGGIQCTPLDPILDAMGWYCGNLAFEDGPAPVGQKQPNIWGLYDMHGNVSEWVWDGFREDYQNLPRVDPAHDVVAGAIRVLRGGSWHFFARSCRSAYRSYLYPDSLNQPGFRPVRTAVLDKDS